MRKLHLLSIMFIMAATCYYNTLMAAEISVASGDNINTAISGASSGDVIVLADGGTYTWSALTLPDSKNITIKAEDGAETPPYFTNGYIYTGNNSSLTLIGLEIYTPNSDAYFIQVKSGQTVPAIKIYDCEIHGYKRCLIRASNTDNTVDSIVIDNSQIYDFSTETWRLMWVRGHVGYVSLTNSTFEDFTESIIYLEGNSLAKKIIINNCTLNNKSASDGNPLIYADGASVSSFSVSNTIFTNIPGTSLFNISANFSDTIKNSIFYFDESSCDTSNTWSYKYNFTKYDPDYANDASLDFTLPNGSPLLSASTTGGIVGDPRWMPDPITTVDYMSTTYDIGLEYMSYWTGDVDTDWETEGNWTWGVPAATDDAIIDGGATNQPVISSSVSCKSLLVLEGATVTIGSGNTLTVADFVICASPSDNTEIGAIVTNGTLSTGKQAYVYRSATADRWRYLTTPVDGIAAGYLDIEGNASHHLYSYNTSGTTWSEITTDATTLSAGIGYAVLFEGEGETILFKGSDLTTGAQSPAVTTAGDAWNLIGNPYTHAIDWDLITKTNVANSLYIRSNGAFVSYVGGVGANGGSEVIPALQAFWVKGTSNGTFDFSADDAYSGDADFKSSELKQLIRITASTETKSDEMVIRFSDYSNASFDENYDAYKLFTSNEEMSFLYSISEDNEKLAINSLPVPEESIDINLGFKNNAKGSFTISLKDVENLEKDYVITLEDKELGKIINLSKEDYTFSSDISEVTSRFVMHIVSDVEDVTGVNTLENSLNVFSANNNIIISSTQQLNEASVAVTDMLGRSVYNNNGTVSSNFIINMNSASGVYNVSVISEGQVYKTKVVLK